MSESQTALIGPAMPIPMPNEPDGPTYIPEFAPRFTEADLAHEVKVDGNGQGFCVGDVHPARRWACSKVERSGGQVRLVPSDGELLENREFEIYYRRFSARVCLRDGRIIALASVSKYHDPQLEPLPMPLKFVNRKLDPDGKGIPITFDPLKPPPETEKKLYRHDGDPYETGDRDLATKMKGLQEAYAMGALDAAALGRAVNALLAGKPIPNEPSPMPMGFDAVKESEEEEIKTAPQEKEEFPAMCGKPCKSLAGKRAHERKCKTCLAMRMT